MVARSVSAEHMETALTLWEAGMPAAEIAKIVGWAGRNVVTSRVAEAREMGDPRATRRKKEPRHVMRCPKVRTRPREDAR